VTPLAVRSAPLSSPIVVPVPVVMSMIAVLRAIVLMVVTAAVVMIAIMVMIAVAVAVYITWFVFPRTDKIHRPIAGVVFLAMLAPILCVPGRHMQVHGRRWHSLRHDQRRLRVNERRRAFVAKLNLAVHARRDLARQNDVNIQVACLANPGTREQYRQD
jgi:hypothetical protein